MSTAYGIYDIEDQYEAGLIDNNKRISEHIYNGLGSIPFWGLAITIGKEASDAVFGE